MLIVAVTGPVGGGKSALLLDVARRLTARGRRVSGFVQVAGERKAEARGAETYDLVFFPGEQSLRWAVRDETRSPRYVFSTEGSERVLAWRDTLDSEVQAIVLDEFGQLEADGGGHYAVWEAVKAVHPPVVLIGVGDRNLEAVATRLGHPFDLVVDARNPKAAERLEKLCTDARDWEAVGLYGTGAGALEVTLGSALHGAKVPMRGQAMSTLQALVLTSAGEGLARKDRVGWVAVVSAGLKALSPAGSRLRPMLAITMQGALFALAVRLLGWRMGAVALGGALIGAWAAGQGILLQWLLVGGDLFKAYDEVVRWIAGQLGLSAPALPVILGAIIALSSALTAAICAFYWSRRHRGLERLRSARPVRKAAPNGMHPVLATLREMAHPSFWLPIVLILAILLLTGSRWESAVWIALRAFAVGLALFSIVRLMRVDRLGEALGRRGLYGPAAAVSRAFRRPPSA